MTPADIRDFALDILFDVRLAGVLTVMFGSAFLTRFIGAMRRML
jgi:hypothetical protein